MIEDFDEKKTKKLIDVLNYEIEQKCLELKENRRNILLKRIFFLGCALSIIIPVLDVFIGYFIIPVLIPIVVFQAVSLILFMPVILNLNGGRNHAERIG